MEKIKLLCLHGNGTNPNIFKDQLRALIAACGDAVEFEFIPGRERCDSTPTILEKYPNQEYFRFCKRSADGIFYDGLDEAVAYVEVNGSYLLNS
jgi:hypothetical protein